MAGSGKVIHLPDPRNGLESGIAPLAVGPEGEPPETTLVRRLRAADPRAERAFIDRYTGHVERILVRILGGHPDLDDMTQDVFVRAFERLHELHEPSGLRRWLTAITVFVAREAIRRRQRRRWLRFLPSEAQPGVEFPPGSLEGPSALP